MTKSIIRIAILFSLLMAAVVCMLSEPTGESRWFFDFFVSKGLGVICFWALAKLYPRWSRDDKWVAKYHKWCMKGVEYDISERQEDYE